jgi:hypothetical protein
MATSGVKIFVGKRIDNALAQSISSFVENARGSNAVMDLPLALFSILTRADADPLLAFASGWAALDKLAEKAYGIISPKDKEKKKRWEGEICDLIKKSQCESDGKDIRSKFLKRFAALTLFLFGDENAEDLESTIKECWDEYKKRNLLYHDGDSVSSPPSIDFLSMTLAKYLYAFLDCRQMRQREKS